MNPKEAIEAIPEDERELFDLINCAAYQTETDGVEYYNRAIAQEFNY